MIIVADSGGVNLVLWRYRRGTRLLNQVDSAVSAVRIQPVKSRRSEVSPGQSSPRLSRSISAS